MHRNTLIRKGHRGNKRGNQNIGVDNNDFYPVSFVITELKEPGFLIDMEKTPTATQSRATVEKMGRGLPENLKPKLVQEKFRTNIHDWWKDKQPADFGLFQACHG